MKNKIYPLFIDFLFDAEGKLTEERYTDAFTDIEKLAFLAGPSTLTLEDGTTYEGKEHISVTTKDCRQSYTKTITYVKTSPLI